MTISIQHNKIHILTILFCAGLMIWIRHHPDSIVWMLLFLSIAINAVLFMTGHGILFISWLAMIIGILGIIMSLPHLWEWSFLQIRESAPAAIPFVGIQSLLYFLATIFFSAVQAFRLFQ